jgi:uncharacterized protein (TIGR02001 family)
MHLTGAAMTRSPFSVDPKICLFIQHFCGATPGLAAALRNFLAQQLLYLPRLAVISTSDTEGTPVKKQFAQHLTVLAAAFVAASAFAQTKAPEPDYTLSFNVGATTDYRYRGISQSRLGPALQGGADFAHKSGFYLGTWGSTIKWIKDGGGSSNLELDVYGGYKGELAEGVAFDVGVLAYIYPGHKLAVSPNTTEIYGAVTFGPATAKYSHSTTNLFGFANTKSSGYLDLSASFDMGNGLSVVPHLGVQRVKGISAASYTDYSVTVNKDFGGGFVGNVALIGTNAKKVGGVPVYISPKGKNLGRNGLVVGVKYNF